ncbi:TPA: hypothetical protein ACYSE6_006605 [Pseudomonas aeruginosa]
MQHPNHAEPCACPVCGAVGVNMAALVAQESREGDWSGSGAGVGLGSSGPGIVVGSASGIRRDRTARAEAFAEAKPSPRARHPVNAILGAAVATLFAGIVFAKMFSMMAARAATSTDPTTQGLAAVAPYAAGVVLVVCVVLAGLAFYKAGGSPDPKALRAFHAAEARDQAREAAYYRLRYCENDHIVFDPLTRRHARAEQAWIAQLIEQLAAA